MEREILFRGRSCDSGSWHEGMPVRASEPPYRICAIDIPEKHARVQIDTETCGQFTGLTDRNGVRIFEGDIIRTYHHGEEINTSFVYWEDGSFWCDVITGSTFDEVESLFDYHYEYGLEVIGNAHDDPEMMKGEMKNV